MGLYVYQNVQSLKSIQSGRQDVGVAGGTDLDPGLFKWPGPFAIGFKATAKTGNKEAQRDVGLCNSTRFIEA